METGKPGAGIVCPSLIDSRLDLSENLNSVQICFSEFLSLLPSFPPSLLAFPSLFMWYILCSKGIQSDRTSQP